MSTGGYMGYHPENLRNLRQAMGSAADDLAHLRCDDPAAAAAMSTIRAARAMLADGWLPFVETLLTCGVLDGYVSARLDGTDLRQSRMLAAQGDGWLLLTDPLSIGASQSTMTEADARALAEVLVDGDEFVLLDTEAEQLWLAGRLDTVAADPDLRAAFESILAPGSTRWAALCDRLALVRLDWHDDDDSAVDSVFASVGRLHPSWSLVEPLLARMEPYSAAVLVTHLDLAVDTLAVAAADIMLRWWTGPEEAGRQWYDDAPWGDQAGDILFRHLAAHPAAATRFLELASEQPGIVLETANDQNNVEALFTAGTSPGRVDPTTAGVIIVAMLRHVVWKGSHGGRIGTTGPSLLELGATLSMPWLLHFSSRASEWPWVGDEATETLATILTDGDALLVVAGMLSSVMNDLRATRLIEDGALKIAAVRDASNAYWDILEALEKQEIAFGDDLRFFFDFFLEVGAIALDFVPMSNTRKLLADDGIPIVVDLLEQWGVIPPDTDAVREIAYKTMQQRAVECAVTIVAIVVHQLVEQGLVPPESLDDLTFADLRGDCMPTLAYERLSAYVLELPLDPQTTTAVWGALNTFFNTSTGRLLCRG